MFDRGTNPTLNVSYTHGSHGHRKDEDGRFVTVSTSRNGQINILDAKKNITRNGSQHIKPRYIDGFC